MNDIHAQIRDSVAQYVNRENIAGRASAQAGPAGIRHVMAELGELGYLGFAEGDPAELGLRAETILVEELSRAWGALGVAVASVLAAARHVEGEDAALARDLRAGKVSVAVGRLPADTADGRRVALGLPDPDVLVFLTQSGEEGALYALRTDLGDCDSHRYEGLDGLIATVVGPGPGLRALPSDAGRARMADRMLLAAAAAGLSAASLDLATAYAGERVQFGKPLGAFGEMRRLLSEAATRTLAVKFTVTHAVGEFDAGRLGAVHAEQVLHLCAEIACLVTLRAQHLHGGYGHMAEFAVGRYLRDSRVLASLAGPLMDLDELVSRHLALPEPGASRKTMPDGKVA